MTVGVRIPQEKLADFCRRWRIRELSLFGSVLRSDFGPDSDIDVMVSFSPDAAWTLLEHIRMEEELKELLGREVEVVSKRAVERSRNHLRREQILKTAQTIYAEG